MAKKYNWEIKETLEGGEEKLHTVSLLCSTFTGKAVITIDGDEFDISVKPFSLRGTNQMFRLGEEAAVSDFLGTDDTILYSSCFDANGGLFETITTAEDAIISDELNHASIIDGVRLAKAQKYRYKNNDMADLEQKLIEATQNGAKQKVIVTDGVFSMDGIIANLKGVCDLAEK